MKRQLGRTILAAALFLILALPCFAGIHYKAVTKTEGPQNGDVQVEGWAAGDNAKVAFVESAGNPVLKEGMYLITKDGGKTLYIVDPKEKTYAEWDLQALAGMAGSVMQGMGPLLKMEVSDPKVEKLLEEDGGTVAGLPTRHYRYRTAYSMKVKVLGMGREASVVTEQDVWATDRLQDVALGVWLRSAPPRTGNEQLDKLVTAEIGKTTGFPLKTVTVSTSTPKKGQPTTTRTTMEVTQLDTDADVSATSFEIPAGYEETQIMPMAAPR